MLKRADLAGNFGAAVVAVFLLQLVDIFPNDVEQDGIIGEDVLIFLDLLRPLIQLTNELFQLQSHELDEAERTDCLGLRD